MYVYLFMYIYLHVFDCMLIETQKETAICLPDKHSVHMDTDQTRCYVVNEIKIIGGVQHSSYLLRIWSIQEVFVLTHSLCSVR